MRLSYFRDDQFGEATVRLGARREKRQLIAASKATPAARAAAENWLGAKWAEIAE